MTHPGDMEMGVQAVKRVREWANASGVAVGAFEPGEEVRSDREVEEWIRENGNLIYHPTSSCECYVFPYTLPTLFQYPVSQKLSTH